jgi:hypothetical protein
MFQNFQMYRYYPRFPLNQKYPRCPRNHYSLMYPRNQIHRVDPSHHHDHLNRRCRMNLNYLMYQTTLLTPPFHYYHLYQTTHGYQRNLRYLTFH